MSSSDEDPNVNIIPMDSFPSDGDMTTWPGHPYAERDDVNWRRLLANNWLERMGSLEKGVLNTLDKLPEGYCLFDKPNKKHPDIRNPALFGHPSGRYFPSQATFLEHFLSIVQGTLDSCKCKLCESMTTGTIKPGRPARVPASASGTQPTPNGDRLADAEGPDYWRMLVRRLKEQVELSEYDALKDICEPNEEGKPKSGGIELKHNDNVDWILTNEALSDLFTRLEVNPAYVPRRGELVLWIWSGLGDGCLMLNPDTGMIEIFENNEWLGVPEWRAGVITDTPTDEVHMVDIVESPDRPTTYSGFRVETLPDPLGIDKSYSRQYSYVPLRNIKPLNTWQLFLNGQERKDIHPSVENALTVMSSWSVVHKIRAKGTWPNMQVDCKGIFIGAELLAVGDTIRLRPRDYNYNQHKNGGSEKVTDVMVVENITVNFTDCIDDPTSEHLAKHYTALITGKMFTTDPAQSNHKGPFSVTEKNPKPLSKDQTTAIFGQVDMSEYGPWYRMAKGQTCNVSPQYVIGRCYEPLAAELMLGTHTFDYDLGSVMEGRNYSQHVDTRMPVGNTWFWGDCRVETLGLTEINGAECGPAALQRETPARWQSILKVSRGETNHAIRRLAGIPSSSGRPFGAKNKAGTKARPKTGFAGVASMSKMVSSAIGSAPDEYSDEMTDENGIMARAVGSDSDGF